ncbi:hypothetical protein EMCRGX_G000120 [Ephydatia muelleri]|eukprot:Em0001g42a
MLKGLSLIALVMAISVDARNLRPNDVSIEAEPYTVLFYFLNMNLQDATIDYTSAARGSVWTQPLPEIVGVANYTIGQVRGPEDGTEAGGLFHISYSSGDGFIILGRIGGNQDGCIAQVLGNNNFAVDIRSAYDITDRTLICTVITTSREIVQNWI